MSNTQPGAASTTTYSTIFAADALRGADAKEALLLQLKKIKSVPLHAVLSYAASAVDHDVQHCLREAKARGQLLICWKGTKAVEVWA